MNVQELREALDNLPGHWPVHVAVNSDHDHGGGADTDFLYTLDVQRDNFPTQGNMAVIRIDYGGGVSAQETAWLNARRKFPEREPTPVTESYWQRGCNDGYAGAQRRWPSSNGSSDPRNRGYSYGWLFGSMKRTAELRAAGVSVLDGQTFPPADADGEK